MRNKLTVVSHKVAVMKNGHILRYKVTIERYKLAIVKYNITVINSQSWAAV